MTEITVVDAVKSPTSKRWDDEPHYEIIDGQKVELPPKSINASRMASRLHGWLGRYCRDRNLGETVMHMLFHLPLAKDRQRRPNIAFVSAQRLAQAPVQPGEDNAWAVVPDLAVEVISPSDPAEDLLKKIEEYFQAGILLVWVVYPQVRLVHIYTSLTQIHGLTEADILEGGMILPGFQLPLKDLFLAPTTPANGNGQQ